MAMELGRGMVDGAVLAAVDWEAAVAGLDAGRLPCSSSEEQMLRLAASIAGGFGWIWARCCRAWTYATPGWWPPRCCTPAVTQTAVCGWPGARGGDRGDADPAPAPAGGPVA